MASVTFTPDGDAIVSEIYIAASPERVFQALVQPQQVLQWWGQEGVYRCTEFEGDLRPGGKWRSAGEGGDNDQFTVVGEYLEVDSPRLLVYSWVASWTGAVKTTVRWELEPTNKGTLVRIRRRIARWHRVIVAGRGCWAGCGRSSKKGRQSRCERHCRPNPSSRRNQRRAELSIPSTRRFDGNRSDYSRPRRDRS